MEQPIIYVTVCLSSLIAYFDIDPQSVWSNFEIADMDFWRSEAYMKFFEYLETQGGFYYEVHTEFIIYFLTLLIKWQFSAGVTHRSIPSLQHFSGLKIKFISSMTLVTNTIRTPIVPWTKIHGVMEGAHVIDVRVLVRRFFTCF